VNEISGEVRLGYIDPGEIETVVTDPHNIEQNIGIVTKRDKHGRRKRFRIIVNGPESVFTASTQKIRESFDDGDCFFSTINALSNSSRGSSDVLSLVDLLDAYEQALFGELERWSFLRHFFWDITLKGATKEEIMARAKQLKPPSPGSNRIHNDNEEWKAVSVDLNAEDTNAIASLIRNHILSSRSIPEHWYGGGGDVNRATASEMGEPVIKAFTMRQRELKYIIEGVATYVLRQWVSRAYGVSADQRLPDEFKPTAVFPDLRVRDVVSYAAALQQVTAAAAISVNAGLMSEKTAVGLISQIATGLGLEIDVENELEVARNDTAERQEKDNFTGRDPEDLPDDAAAEDDEKELAVA
jgi:hypothetical protein